MSGAPMDATDVSPLSSHTQQRHDTEMVNTVRLLQIKSVETLPQSHIDCDCPNS